MIPSKLTSPSAPAFKSGKSTQFLEEVEKPREVIGLVIGLRSLQGQQFSKKERRG